MATYLGSHTSSLTASAFEEIPVLHEQVKEEDDYRRTKGNESCGGLLGQSPALKKILSQIELVGPTEASVLILGESGTGKELIARALHNRSRRACRALVKVNCASIPRELFESEFFGHVKGSFTGALRDRVGRFQLADGGTLFLDEIAEIPVELQCKLLRVLQEGEFERVGEDRTRQVDVRVIAATNLNLKHEVGAGRFRQDLYFRLSVFPLKVPPLRERPEDVPLLVRHFMAEYAQRLNKRIEIIPQSAMDAMKRYSWPGNVRELQNFIGRAVILTQGPVLDPPLSELQCVSHKIVPEPTTLEDAERYHILRILEQTNGRLAPAAELLGVPRTTLFYKIRRLGIETRRSAIPGHIAGES
jgi:formate hydrogenlyase transcriptional activator